MSQLKFDFESIEDKIVKYPPAARRDDPVTSHKAALKVRAGSIRALILSTLRAHGNLATYQIADILDRDRDSVSPHMSKLEEVGLVRRTGETIVRAKTGKECELWQVAST